MIYVQLRLPFLQLVIRGKRMFLQLKVENSHGSPVIGLAWVMCTPWANHCGWSGCYHWLTWGLRPTPVAKGQRKHKQGDTHS